MYECTHVERTHVSLRIAFGKVLKGKLAFVMSQYACLRDENFVLRSSGLLLVSYVSQASRRAVPDGYQYGLSHASSTAAALEYPD